MKLVACLSTGKGTWGHVSRLIADGEWEEIFLITNSFGKENFSNEKKARMIEMDFRRGIEELRDEMVDHLKDKFKTETEVAVNIISGEGKEHIALISALLKCGVGIKFFALTKDGIKEI